MYPRQGARCWEVGVNEGDRVYILEGERLITNKHIRQSEIDAIKEIGRKL